jgi:hypothetical protein
MEANTARVVLANENSPLYDPDDSWLPVKAIRRLISWPPVGAVVQVIDESVSSGMDMAHDVVWNRFFFFFFKFISNLNLHLDYHFKKQIDSRRFWTR